MTQAQINDTQKPLRKLFEKVSAVAFAYVETTTTNEGLFRLGAKHYFIP